MTDFTSSRPRLERRLRMKSILITTLLLPGALAFADSHPALVRPAHVAIPQDACSTQRGICRATLHFVIQPSGKPSDIRIDKSSGYRPCDMTAYKTVAERLYSAIQAPLAVIETVSPFSCPARVVPPGMVPAGT